MVRPALVRLVSALGCVVVLAACSAPPVEVTDPILASLVFHASFDETFDADEAAGDGRVHTAADEGLSALGPGMNRADASIRRHAGRFDGCARFDRKENPQVLVYPGTANTGHRPEDWGGTLSVWISVDPIFTLGPGPSDPVLLRAGHWTDGALWLEFADEGRRPLRAGVARATSAAVTGDRSEEERPLVTTRSGSFTGGSWAHVVLTWSGLNGSERARLELYVDGRSRGSWRGLAGVDWDDDAVVMIGHDFNGRMDDLAVFDRPLTADEVAALHVLPGGVGFLRDRPR